ncbi:MAG: tyrosine-type recombinase/integrase family protein [Solirubrobacterales bacterium]|nr:tyrosine-type recombinase/integrase family protein [Solirubrobacterales bacterium]
MSVSFYRGGWETRWRDANGRRRAKRFPTEAAARGFDQALAEVLPTARRADTARHGRNGGVYSYPTAHGVRWRLLYRRSDGTQTTKRGFASERAARDARRQLIEQVERGELKHTKETFADYWQRWLDRRRPYLESGTWSGYEIAGRTRLVPTFGRLPLGELSVDAIRDFVAELAGDVEAGELAAKTVNNALGILVVCLNSAVEDGVLAVNPALRVQRLPPAHIEREYLRLDEIPRYLDSCSGVYRPLAELLIGSGLRISEALALRIGDLDLEDTRGAIIVYRSRKGSAVGSTKSDRFRAVEIGPGLSAVLRDQVARCAELAAGDGGSTVLFTMPIRTVKRSMGRWESAGASRPLDRSTVSRDWHKDALQDAALRDMPLHALRHTAAAAWLAAGTSLMYVQRQLGHADIGTTERYYGHLERRVLAAGAIATEDAIARARTRPAGARATIAGRGSARLTRPRQ